MNIIAIKVHVKYNYCPNADENQYMQINNVFSM